MQLHPAECEISCSYLCCWQLLILGNGNQHSLLWKVFSNVSTPMESQCAQSLPLKLVGIKSFLLGLFLRLRNSNVLVTICCSLPICSHFKRFCST